MSGRLHGRSVVVTGAGSGIGNAIARHLAVNEGAKVVVTGRRAEPLEQLADEVGCVVCTGGLGLSSQGLNFAWLVIGWRCCANGRAKGVDSDQRPQFFLLRSCAARARCSHAWDTSYSTEQMVNGLTPSSANNCSGIPTWPKPGE